MSSAEMPKGAGYGCPIRHAEQHTHAAGPLPSCMAADEASLGDMKQFVDAVRRAVDEKNWYAALSLALTLPDIASKIEHPEVKGSVRYAAWCDVYLTPKYTSSAGYGHKNRTWMTGLDTYSLRCAVLHQGIDQVAPGEVEDRVRGFRFLAPRPGWRVHQNSTNGRLQLQVDIFCLDICDAVDAWWISSSRLPLVSDRVASLMKIEPPAGELRL